MSEQRDLPPDELLSEIEAFCSVAGMSKSSFGASAVGDPKFVFDLKGGREPRRKTVRKVLKFIANADIQDGAA